MAVGLTRRAGERWTPSGEAVECASRGSTHFACGSNKPMVPTAPNPLDEYPLGPVRRHIGQPFDSGAATSSVKALGFSLDTQKSKTRTTDVGNELRVMGSAMRAASNEQHPTSNDLRRAGFVRLEVSGARCERRASSAVSNELRATSNELRATSNELRATGSEQRATGCGQRATCDRSDEEAHSAGSNKPVLPTATTWLTDDSLDSGRRQTGQPFGSGRPFQEICLW